MQNGDSVFNHKLYLTVPIVTAYHALVLQLAAITPVDFENTACWHLNLKIVTSNYQEKYNKMWAIKIHQVLWYWKYYV